MKQYVTLLLFIFLFSQNIKSQDGRIHLENPSFEGEPKVGTIGGALPSGWIDCGFAGESVADVLPKDYGDAFGVAMPPFDGNTYFGLIVRDNDTWERVSQRLTAPMRAGRKYSFSIYLCRSLDYIIRKKGTEDLVNFITPVKLRIWGGVGHCNSTELLAESTMVTNDEWERYDFLFTPKIDCHNIMFEAHYQAENKFAYNGNLLMDYASSLNEVHNPVEPKIDLNNEAKMFSHFFMESKISVEIFEQEDLMAEEIVLEAFARADEIEKTVRTEIDMLHKAAKHGDKISVSDEMLEMLAFAKSVYKRSSGSFDVTTVQLKAAWEKATLRKEIPDQNKIKELLKLSGIMHINITRDGMVRIKSSKLQLDLSGLALAYALDRMGDIFYEYGYGEFSIKSGNMNIYGEIPKERGNWSWQRPYFKNGTRQFETLPIWNSAIVISEPKLILQKGKEKYFDLIDPVTGLAIQHASITTIETVSCMEAYAWATALAINYDADFYSWLEEQDTRIWYSEP